MRGLDAVRGHAATLGRQVRPRVGIGLVLVLLTLATTSRAQEPSASPSREPITLAADRVQFWDESPELRWVVLDGKASVSQGALSWRSDRGVIRIETSADGH